MTDATAVSARAEGPDPSGPDGVLEKERAMSRTREPTPVQLSSSVDAILRALARDRPAAGTVTAADLYSRSLDCQNQGGFALLERHAALVTEYSALGEGQRVLDAGCGLGGPGRYLADRFGCAVTGIDVLQARVQAAATLTRMVGLDDRVAYCQVDATRLPFAAPSSGRRGCWM